MFDDLIDSFLRWKYKRKLLKVFLYLLVVQALFDLPITAKRYCYYMSKFKIRHIRPICALTDIAIDYDNFVKRKIAHKE